MAEPRIEYFPGSKYPKQVVFTDKFGVTITGPRGTQFIPNTRTETVSTQLVQGSQNRISQTQTNIPDLSNQMSGIITGAVVGAAGIAGMYAVKPSVKQFVNKATQEAVRDSEKSSPIKSEVDFQYSQDTKSPSDVKIVDISAIIKQAAGPTDTHIGAGEATFIQPDDSTTDTESGSKQKIPETTIGPAPEDANQKIKAQENKKPLTFKEMDKTKAEELDKIATHTEGINTLFFGGPLYFAVNKMFPKFGGLTLAGFQLFNKALLMTGQIPLENKLTTNGDTMQAIGHEVNTLGTGMLLSFIPYVGPAVIFADAGISALTGTSFLEETVRVVENVPKNMMEAEYNRRWDESAPEPQVLEDYAKKLEKSIQESEPGERRDKMQKLLKKVREYKSEVARRKSVREFNKKMFDREFTSFEP
jgi:hypothetical protein